VSSLTVTTRWPSGEKAAPLTLPEWLSSLTSILPGGSIAELQHLVIADGYQTPAVGRKSCTINSFHHGEHLPAGGILHRAVLSQLVGLRAFTADKVTTE
jgi:hypothetical protein